MNTNMSLSTPVMMLLGACTGFILIGCSDATFDNYEPDNETSAFIDDEYHWELDGRPDDTVVVADAAGPSAQQLVQQHDIHRRHMLYFPLDSFNTTDPMQLARMSLQRLNSLTTNTNVIEQIKLCHTTTMQSDGVMASTYLHGSKDADDEAVRQYGHQLYQAYLNKYAPNKGQSLENDLHLYYIALAPNFSLDSNGRLDALYDAFWQWCIALPNTHWTGRYQDNPIQQM